MTEFTRRGGRSDARMPGWRLKVHGRSSNLQDCLAAETRPLPNAGALVADAPPAALGSQIAEPKGEAAALKRPHIIDSTTRIKEGTVAGVIFTDTVTVFKRVKIIVDEARRGKAQIGGYGTYFRWGHINGAGFAYTAVAALLALETDALIKEIGPLLQRFEYACIHAWA